MISDIFYHEIVGWKVACILAMLDYDTQDGTHTDMSGFAKTEVSKVAKVLCI